MTKEIKNCKELINYICRLKKQGVPILSIVVEKRWFYNNFDWDIFPKDQKSIKTILGFPLIILERPSYSYKENFHIITGGRQ